MKSMVALCRAGCLACVWLSYLAASAVAQTQQVESAVPMALDNQVDSIWQYLQQKYDADGDARITEDEYARAGGQFARLDRDGDGRITSQDFERRGSMREERMRAMRAQRLVAMYFQVDGADRLTIDELQQAVAAYDTNGDRHVDADEFAAAAEERKVQPSGGDSRRLQRALRGVAPFAALLAAVDRDGNGQLEEAELLAFFRQHDDGDGVWTLARETNPSRRDRQGGAPVGEVAPDFTLRPPHDGEVVTLSDFKGKRPVALIFGSYT